LDRIEWRRKNASISEHADEIEGMLLQFQGAVKYLPLLSEISTTPFGIAHAFVEDSLRTGVLVFGDIVQNFGEKYPEARTQELLSHLKGSYAALSASLPESIFEKMTSIRDVRAFDVADLVPSKSERMDRCDL
jgi:hypothetical protein